jgi:hypothetical protein
LRTGAAKAHHADVFNVGNVCVSNAGLGSYRACPINPPPNPAVNRTRRLMFRSTVTIGAARRLP